MFAILLCTGMRSGELAGNRVKKLAPLPWSAVDLDAGVIRLGDHKTVDVIGEKVIYLCPEIVSFMRALPRENDLVLVCLA